MKSPTVYWQKFKKEIQLVNGKFVGTPKVTQLIESKCAEKFNILVKPVLLSINPNNYWLAGFLESDGCIFIEITKRSSYFHLRVKVVFSQKNPELLYCIANLFPGKKVSKSIDKNGNICFTVGFTSLKEISFWVNYLQHFHLQGRKYWQFLKMKECFHLILQARKEQVLKITPAQKKQNREKLLEKASQLQKELREMEIPLSVRKKKIPLYAGRFSLMLKEMDQIDELLANSQLNYGKIAEAMGISRDLLNRYRKNTERYRSKPLIDKTLRRQNTKFISD